MKETLDKEISEAGGRLKELTEAYEKDGKLLEQNNNYYSKWRRMFASTSFEMISNNRSSTRYRRREEAKNML